MIDGAEGRTWWKKEMSKVGGWMLSGERIMIGKGEGDKIYSSQKN